MTTIRDFCKNCGHTIERDIDTDKVIHLSSRIALCGISYCMCFMPCPKESLFLKFGKETAKPKDRTWTEEDAKK